MNHPRVQDRAQTLIEAGVTFDLSVACVMASAELALEKAERAASPTWLGIYSEDESDGVI